MEKIRKEIIDKSIDLVLSNRVVALEFATGVGKSRAALECINALYREYKGQHFKVLLVVAEVPHKDNWYQEAIKWNFKHWDKVDVTTYHSLHKYTESEYVLTLYDEGHHMGTDIRIDIIKQIKCDKVLILSATLSNTIKDILFVTFLFHVVSYKIPLQTAIELGLIPKPKVCLIPLELDNTKRTEVVEMQWGKKVGAISQECIFEARRSYFNRTKYPNMKLKIHCTPLQKYIYLTDQVEYYKRLFNTAYNPKIKNVWMQWALKRKQFLGESKTSLVIPFLDTIKDKRHICFCSTIEQSEILNKSNSINSKRRKALDVIDQFNNHEIDSIYAVNMLKEGQNLVDIEVGVIVQLDGAERAFIQKFGRSLRAEDPIQYIFYYKNTRDEEYLNNVLLGIDPTFIKTINCEEISNI